MDKNVNQEIARAKRLLAQAMSAAAYSLPNDSNVKNVKYHIGQAINKLDVVEHKNKKKRMNMTEYEKWWGHIQAGIAKSATSATAHSAEAKTKALAELNKMIAAEQAKLDELQKKSDEAPTTDSKDLYLD